MKHKQNQLNKRFLSQFLREFLILKSAVLADCEMAVYFPEGLYQRFLGILFGIYLAFCPRLTDMRIPESSLKGSFCGYQGFMRFKKKEWTLFCSIFLI